MIRNFTEAEWSALSAAVDYYGQVLEESDWPGWKAKQAALDRAYAKARQLAPEAS
jgi:hypothetical protein